MSTVEELIEPLRHSPHLPKAVAILLAELKSEQQRREQFYAEMSPDKKAEFIDGNVVLHSPARNCHLNVTGHVFKLLHTYVTLHQLGEVKSEKCLCVFPRNDYEPDIVFFGPEKCASLTADTMKFPIPDLAVEILSPSTEKLDRGLKFEDYAINQVAEYWIIDAEAKTVEQYLIDGGNYKLEMKSGSGVLESRAIRGLSVRIEAFFDNRANLMAMKKMLSDS